MLCQLSTNPRYRCLAGVSSPNCRKRSGQQLPVQVLPNDRSHASHRVITKIRRQKSHPQWPLPIVLRSLGSSSSPQNARPTHGEPSQSPPGCSGIVLQRKNQVAVCRRGVGKNRDRLPDSIARPDSPKSSHALPRFERINGSAGRNFSARPYASTASPVRLRARKTLPSRMCPRTSDESNATACSSWPSASASRPVSISAWPSASRAEASSGRRSMQRRRDTASTARPLPSALLPRGVADRIKRVHRHAAPTSNQFGGRVNGSQALGQV